MEKQTFEEMKGKRYALIYGEPYKFDKYDRAILRALHQDARSSLADISAKVGLSRDAVRGRIKKMIKADVIHAFRPILNPPKIGFPIINYVCIALHRLTPAAEERFISYLQKHPNITYVATAIGKWDYILYVLARNPGAFSLIMKDLRQKFSEIIKDYDVYGVLEELKYEEEVAALGPL